MVDLLGFRIGTVTGALALALISIVYLAPLAAGIISRRLRAECARDIQLCRDNPADMFTSPAPPLRVVRLAHWMLCGIWTIASVVMWFSLGMAAWPYAGFLLVLLVLAMTDLDVQLLPGQLVGALLWSGVLGALFDVVNLDLADSVLGVVYGWVLFSIPNWLLAATRRCNDPAMGQGDISLLAACGAWLGPLDIVLAAGITLSLALVVKAVLGRFTVNVPQRLPFGPLIAVGAAVVLSVKFSLVF